MNVSGCRSIQCHDHLHSSACSHTAKNLVGNTDQGKYAAIKTDLLILSDEAKSMRLKESEDNTVKNSGSDLSSEDHEHDHDHAHDDDDDHEGLSKKVGLNNELSKEELKQVRELQVIDRQVRSHEQAHVSASGRIATSAPSYEFETGPDGRRYAVGGSVSYNMPPASTPEEELLLAQQLRRMALAPMDPSPKDRATAAKAAVKEASANREIREERAEEFKKQSAAMEKIEEDNQGPGESKKAADINENVERTIMAAVVDMANLTADESSTVVNI